jgi:hypothetical protein
MNEVDLLKIRALLERQFQQANRHSNDWQGLRDALEAIDAALNRSGAGQPVVVLEAERVSAAAKAIHALQCGEGCPGSATEYQQAEAALLAAASVA